MLRTAIFYGLLILSFCAHADVDAFNRVDFQVEAAREVGNDLLTANLNASIQNRQPAIVASELNTILNSALKLATAYPAVKTSSGNQSTYPVSDKNNQISAWRGAGQIHLESKDFKAAGELIMKLQESMQLSGVQFSVSPDTRLTIENVLIDVAIKAFQQRAEAIRSAVGTKSYRIVHFSINSAGMPPQFQMLRSSRMADQAIPAPEFAGGESRLTVQINGTIELQ